MVVNERMDGWRQRKASSTSIVFFFFFFVDTSLNKIYGQGDEGEDNQKGSRYITSGQ